MSNCPWPATTFLLIVISNEPPMTTLALENAVTQPAYRRTQVTVPQSASSMKEEKISVIGITLVVVVAL